MKKALLTGAVCVALAACNKSDDKAVSTATHTIDISSSVFASVTTSDFATNGPEDVVNRNNSTSYNYGAGASFTCDGTGCF